MKRSGLIWACPVLIFGLVVACGGTTPPPEEPKPEPTVAPPPPPPEPEPVAEEPDAGEPEEPPPAEEPKQPRRPLAIYNDPSGPVTVGLDGAVIRVGSAELRVPGGSLNVARNVWFKVESRYKGDKGKVGDVYLIEVRTPDRKYQMGEARASRAQPTSGDNFVLKLPLPKGSDSANLAIETIELDAKNKPKASWVVIAQTKLETADTGNRAVFEMGQLPDAHVHLTTASAGGE